MSKNKLQKFAENEGFTNLFQPDYADLLKQGFHLKGKWHRDFFKNHHSIVLELGCGKGEYTIGLAEDDKQKNFIGFDIKGARIWKGCKYANEQGMKNVAFVRTKVQNIPHFFDKNEVDEIWITFPDPQPRKSKANKRLTSPPFLKAYSCVLKNEGIIHLKTDDPDLYAYTLEVIEEEGHTLLFSTDNLYESGIDEAATRIQTYYEGMWLEEGRIIHYLRFRMNYG